MSRILPVTLAAALAPLGACAPTPEAPPSNATVFTGATVIVGDGSDPIENAVFVIEDDRFVAVGAAGEVTAPAGAAAVDLTGRTVIPALIDTHVHLRVDREGLVDDLHRRAYYGVGAAMSLGHDDGGRGGRAAGGSASRGGARPDRRARHHPSRAGPLRGALLDQHRRGGTGRGPGDRRGECGHREDLGGRPRRPVRQADQQTSTARSSRRRTSTASG